MKSFLFFFFLFFLSKRFQYRANTAERKRKLTSQGYDSIASGKCRNDRKHNYLKPNFRGLAFSSEWGSQMYKMSASIKLRPPLFRQQQFYDPHHRYTLPLKQAKIVLKSVFLNKINTLSVVIL